MPGCSRRTTPSASRSRCCSWSSFDPRPIDAVQYRLTVRGAVARPIALSLAQVPAVDELVATLDCTGGFYSTQRWRGLRLGRLIDEAGALRSARHVRVLSQTGYRWGFSLADARSLLLATHVGDEALSHEHGAPARLVVPDARGFQWVKWVTRIELLEHPDYGAPASTIWSSFTAAGSDG
jgi:DMSO/TMAO reductase YedYZ molybdopterin-dependent catalytic subunit